MKLSQKEINDFILSDIGSKKLPVRLGFAVSLNAKKLAPFFQAFDEMQRQLIEKYGKRNDTGELEEVDGMGFVIEDQKGYIEDFKSLLEAEHDVDILTVPFEILEQSDADGYDKLTADNITALEFMIEK